MTESNADRLHITIVSDVVCPWCIVGYKQLEQAMKQAGIEADIVWQPFELNPQMPAEGQNLREHVSEKYGTSAEDSAKYRVHMLQLGEELGFEFSYADDMRMHNTFKAHQLLHWANEHGKQHELKLALFAAHFTQRKNVNDDAVLADVAASVGLDRDDAMSVLTSGRLAQEVRAEQRFWTDQGIQGVPAMIFNKRHLVTGAQGVENYTSILRQLTSSEAA